MFGQRQCRFDIPLRRGPSTPKRSAMSLAFEGDCAELRRTDATLWQPAARPRCVNWTRRRRLSSPSTCVVSSGRSVLRFPRALLCGACTVAGGARIATGGASAIKDFLVIGAYPPSGSIRRVHQQRRPQARPDNHPQSVRPRKHPVYGTKDPSSVPGCRCDELMVDAPYGGQSIFHCAPAFAAGRNPSHRDRA